MGCASRRQAIHGSGDTDEADIYSLTSSAILRPIHRPSTLQTADIAQRLMQGRELHQEEGASS